MIRALPGWDHTITLGAQLPQLGPLPTADDGGRAGPGHGQPFRLDASAQRLHAMIVGRSGSGKSSLLLALFCQHLNARHGVGILEPHADLSQDTLAVLVQAGFFRDGAAFERLLYVDWGNGGYLPFNILAPTRGVRSSYALARNALEGITRCWPELAQAPMFQTLFLASMLVLIENRLPITYLYRLLSDAPFRAACLTRVGDPVVREAFAHYEKLGKGQAAATGSLWRRSFLLGFTPAMRYTLGQPENRLDFRRLMDEGTAVILNLGNLGDGETRTLLGTLLMVQLEQAALSRADTPPATRRPFTLLLDEWPTFAAGEQSLTTILEQARKYGLSLYLAGQSVGQVASARLASALENCRLTVCFAVGASSAETMARQVETIAPGLLLPPGPGGGPPRPLSAAAQHQAWVRTLQALPPRRAFAKLHDQPAVKLQTLTVPRLDGAGAEELARVLAIYRARYQRSQAEAEAAIERIALPLAGQGQSSEPVGDPPGGPVGQTSPPGRRPGRRVARPAFTVVDDLDDERELGEEG